MLEIAEILIKLTGREERIKVEILSERNYEIKKIRGSELIWQRQTDQLLIKGGIGPKHLEMNKVESNGTNKNEKMEHIKNKSESRNKKFKRE